jgi:hypothetical protein
LAVANLATLDGYAGALTSDRRFALAVLGSLAGRPGVLSLTAAEEAGAKQLGRIRRSSELALGLVELRESKPGPHDTD